MAGSPISFNLRCSRSAAKRGTQARNRLWFDTQPPGASISYQPYENVDGQWIVLGETPFSEIHLENMLRLARMGAVIMPDSDRLTRSTLVAWALGGMFLCTTPMPPARAMAMAISASVTVSMAALRKGICRRIDFVRSVAVSMSAGMTSEYPGTSRTSSNVKASRKLRWLSSLISSPFS